MGKSNTKALTALVKQMDELYETLEPKQRASILIEKASLVRQVVAMEQASEDAKAEAAAELQAKRIVELESELARARERIKTLERTSITRMLEQVSVRTSDRKGEAAQDRQVVPVVPREPAKPTTAAELASCGVPMAALPSIPLTPPKAELKPTVYVPDIQVGRKRSCGMRRHRFASRGHICDSDSTRAGSEKQRFMRCPRLDLAGHPVEWDRYCQARNGC